MEKNIIYVSSYPKSGSTWFRFLIYALYHRKLAISSTINAFYPAVKANPRMIKERLEEYEEEGNDSLIFLKSHHAYSSDLKYHDNIKAAIILIREPFNIMFSNIDHRNSINNKLNDKEVNYFLNRFIDKAHKNPSDYGDQIHGGWSYYVNSWLGNQLPFPLLVIKYEDLLQSSTIELQRVCSFLNLPFSKSRIEFASKLGRFKNMKYIEKLEREKGVYGFTKPRQNRGSENNSFFNKGKERKSYSNLNLETKIKGLKSFESGLKALGYNNYLDKINYFKKEGLI